MVRPDINVTPLIDVLLVLLIIFMVVTPVRPGRMDAKIPSEPTRDIVTPNPDTLVVVVAADGTLSLNQHELGADANSTEPLTEALKTVFREREANLNLEHTVFVKAPKSIGYGTVARVVDAIRTAGASPIGLQIDRLDP